MRCWTVRPRPESVTHRNLSIALHDADLDVLCTGLHNLEQALHCELDGVISRHIVLVVLLQEFANGFRRTTDRVRL